MFNRLRAFLAILAMVACSTAALTAAQITIRGRVTDAASGDPLIAVNVRLLGTARGTVSNATGNYALTVDAGTGRQTLVFSLLGYLPDTLVLATSRDTICNIVLKQSPIQMPEVVVSSEDPAIEIIRKAIAHKHEWMEKLKSYRFDAFTRTVIRRDTVIASITESYTTGYGRAGDTLREIIRQKRQTQNIPGNDNFTSVRRILNFNDDEIVLLKLDVDEDAAAYVFVGPTAPDALDNYEFKLLKTSLVNGVETYQIRMTPKSKFKPLFAGTISIADRTFAVMGVDVTPNEIFAIPFVKDITLHYQQEFALYDDEFWMPTNIRINGGLTVGMPGFSMPHANIEISSAIYDYAINVPLPDSVLHARPLRVDSAAAVYDSSFWAKNEVLPLTSEEQQAYASLDSTETLEKQFEIKGPFGGLGNDKSWSATELLDARFNRVEGFYAGGKFSKSVLAGHVKLDGSLGYGFSDKLGKFDAGAEWFPSATHRLGLGIEAYRRMDHVPDGGYYGAVAIGLMSLFDKNDYRDYFLTDGFHAYATVQPGKKLTATAGFVNERQRMVANATDFSIFGGGKSYRPNPTITDGNLRAVQLQARIGDEPAPLGLVSRRYLELALEYSSPSLASSDFDYARYQASLTWNIRTFGRSLLMAPVLQMRISGGTATGTLPPQRSFIVDTRASGYGPFGVLKAGHVMEFVGQRYAAATVEHNFRTLPFIALGLPFLYRNNIEFIVHGAAAQTWGGTVSPPDGWYSEAGIGFSRIFELFRADLTWRFKAPRELAFSLGVAQIL